MSSILTDIKASLGLADDYTAFDSEIIMFTNAALADLHQLGVGPPTGLAITDKTSEWDELIEGDARLNQVKSYIFLTVKLLHDPPTIGFVLTAMKELRDEATWRVQKAYEDIVDPYIPPEDRPERDEFGDPVVIDGGNLDG